MNRHKREIEDKLKQINDVLVEFNLSTDIVLVGGAAFILRGLVDRATEDFDFINKVSEQVTRLLFSRGFDVNDHVKIFDYQFGWNWMGDISLLEEFSNLRVLSISTERLMVGRLFSNRRHEDFEEAIKHGKISQDKFESVFEEVYENAIYMEERSFYENAYMVKDLYKTKGWDYENSNIKDLCEVKINNLL